MDVLFPSLVFTTAMANSSRQRYVIFLILDPGRRVPIQAGAIVVHDSLSEVQKARFSTPPQFMVVYQRSIPVLDAVPSYEQFLVRFVSNSD